MAQLDPVKGSEQAGTRPMIVVSRDSINLLLRVVIGIPTTDRNNLRKLAATHVELAKGVGGLTMNSVALCEKVRAIDKCGFLRHMGTLPPTEMGKVEEALRAALVL
ncbi:MAG: type II toxin-antitoxin system PemK/MazF family toxin [Acidobacteriia bacterium]|nr:type II toxin-antitoxin system PemK/MazF family toxin [Terriglobia bacterium]